MDSSAQGKRRQSQESSDIQDDSSDSSDHGSRNGNGMGRNSSKKEKVRKKSQSGSESDSSAERPRTKHRHHDRSHNRHSHRKGKSRRSGSKKRSRSHRSEERSRRHSRSRSRDRGHSHRSSRNSHRHSDRRRSRSPRRRKSPRKNDSAKDGYTRSSSPPGYDRAMAAQERLARRLDRAKELMRKKEEMKIKEKGLKKGDYGGDPIQEAVRRAAELVSSSMPETSQPSLSAHVSAQVEALKAKAFADTGIEVPSYYNPLAVNPISYAQQAAKRKKLWAKKDGDTSASETASSTSAAKNAMWSGVKFGDDKSNEKFAKLMGIKSEKVDANVTRKANEIIKKQAEVFQNLDLQYQQARITTHTQRGLGLGFSSTAMVDPNAAPTSQSSIS